VALAREATPASALAAGDVSALAAWQAVGPRQTLVPLGQAPPGYAVLAALAAQLAHADRRVVAFTNAGGLAAGERALGLAVALGLAIVVVALEAPDATTAARMERAGVPSFVFHGEPDFAWSFSRACLAGRPAVVVVAAPERVTAVP
jgi:acetolactate synthase-1/2/3 large subunit